MARSDLRSYEARARSTDVFGRVLCQARTNHYVSDGPVQNGCPGEAPTPQELFLSSVAACGVELLQVIAHEEGIDEPRVEVDVCGVIDRANPARQDFMVFNSVRLHFAIAGVSRADADRLVESFKRR